MSKYSNAITRALVANNSRCLVSGVACALLAVLPACGDGTSRGPGQVMARVNGADITVHQVNHALANLGAQNVARDDGSSRRVLDALVVEQLLVEQATDAKLDRDPQVLQALEQARRQILSRAYLERNVAVPRPGAAEVQAFYAEHPALFQNRRVYSFRDYLIDRAQYSDALRGKVDAVTGGVDVPAMLKAAKVDFREASNVRGAEQLPLEMLPRIAALNKGEISVLLTENSVVLMQLVGFTEQPVALDKATPFIEQYMVNARKKQLVESKIKELRASAKIAYPGQPADDQGETTSSAKPRPVATAPAAPRAAGTGVEEDSIKKGLQGFAGK